MMTGKPSALSRFVVVGSIVCAALLIGGCAPAPTADPLGEIKDNGSIVSLPADPTSQPTPSPVLCTEQNNVTHTDPVMGVTISSPAHYQLLADRYLSDEYGFILSNSVGEPVIRVAWHHEATAGDQEKLVGEMIASLTGIPVSQTPIEVDGREAILLSPVPGEVVNTLLYVPVDDRLYTVCFFKGELDNQDHCLLDSLRFETPTQSLTSLNLTPIADTLNPAPATETALVATETAAQAPPATVSLDTSPSPLALSDVATDWARHDFAEWGLALSMPVDWKKERMPGFFSFTPPAGDNAQMTVGLQDSVPTELPALTGALEASWGSLTPLDFYITPITVADIDSLAIWNTSPTICADVYIPAHGIVRHLTLGAIFCNETRDWFNEVGLKILDTVEIDAPGPWRARSSCGMNPVANMQNPAEAG